MNEDGVVILASVGGFLLFIVLQAIIFRRLDEAKLFKSLIVITLFAMSLGSLAAFFLGRAEHLNVGISLASAFFAIVLIGLVCFVYVLCIFGPFTTSVRMRIIREFEAAGQGLTLNELKVRYNESVIFDLRILRLRGGGEILQRGDLFYPGTAKNMFMVLDKGAAFIKWLIGQG